MAVTNKKSWWDTLPPDVQVLLNRAQDLVRTKKALGEIRDLDLVHLRSNGRVDLNVIVDRVASAEEDLRDAMFDYERAGGNHRQVDE